MAWYEVGRVGAQLGCTPGGGEQRDRRETKRGRKMYERERDKASL